MAAKIHLLLYRINNDMTANLESAMSIGYFRAGNTNKRIFLDSQQGLGEQGEVLILLLLL